MRLINPNLQLWLNYNGLKFTIYTTIEILWYDIQNYKYKNKEQNLRTLMCEVEAIINGQPITPASNDPNDLDV